jgi:hypothetical protein
MSFKSLFIILLFFIVACKEETKDSVDISNISLENEVSIVLPSEAGLFSKEDLQNVDSVFVDLYINQVLGIASMNEGDGDVDINEIFIEDWVKELNDSIKLEYSQMDDILKDFDTAFRYLKYYFPTKPTPNIYFCNSLFNYQRFLFEDSKGDAIGVGLDMFLKDYYDYKMIDPQNPAYSDYLTIHFDRHHIVPKSLQLVIDEIVERPNGVRLIDQMIHNGKKMYILERLMPETSKHLLFDYTQAQYQWCEDNEFEIWSFFNSEKLMYETAPAKIAKYLNESPTSPGMPAESPGRTANYLGWKIVSKWMSQSNSSIDQLIAKIDAQDILDEARYKPKRK